jgi:DNA-binding MurR/RpiR family transcriptional regulator
VPARSDHAEPLDTGALARVRRLLPSLPAALRRVAETTVEMPSVVARSTIVDLAERSGTSTATITRFCRAAGFEGYNDFRVSLATEVGRSGIGSWGDDMGGDIQPSDSLERALAVIVNADLRAVQQTAAQLDLRVVEEVAEVMASARRVVVFGVSGSAAIGEEFHLCLHRIGIPSWVWSEVHGGLASAALLGPEDVALAISHSGSAVETVEMLRVARQHGALTVALTNTGNSPVTEVADHVLTTAVRETSFRQDVRAARHSQLIVLDLIYVAIAQRTYERANEAFARTAEAIKGHRLDQSTDMESTA